MEMVHIIVAFNIAAYEQILAEFCDKLLLLASDGARLLSDNRDEIIECIADENRMDESELNLRNERNSTFWIRAHSMTVVENCSYTVNGITLIQLIDLSYELCDIIHEEYKSIVDELLGMITARLTDLNDKIDEDESLQMMQRYEGEIYLRQLYCKLKEQLMNDLGKQGSLLLYVGSRQQCLYGCICFVLTFFFMYNRTDLMLVKNFYWFHRTVIQGRCSFVALSSCKTTMK